MTTFGNILCPVDHHLNLTTDEALRYALAFVRAYEAKLFVFYCADVIDPSKALSLPATTGYLKEIVDRAIELYVPEIERPALIVECGIVPGDDVGEAITCEARDRDIDLIVMGSRRRPLRAALLGSTAETVCRTAPCPVLVTHRQERGWVGMSTGEVNLERLLVAYDFSEGSALALTHGLSLAQTYQSELHLLHVLPKLDETELEITWDEAAAEGAYHKAARRLQKSVPPEVHLWCKKVVNIVRWGKPYNEILEYAKENRIDQICMGAHGAGFRDSALFGSNTDRVLRQSPCPVLVARGS